MRWSMSGRKPKPTAFWAEVSGNHAGARGYENKAFRRTPKTTVKKLASKLAPKLKKIEKPNKAQKEKPLEKPKAQKEPKKARRRVQPRKKRLPPPNRTMVRVMELPSRPRGMAP